MQTQYDTRMGVQSKIEPAMEGYDIFSMVLNMTRFCLIFDHHDFTVLRVHDSYMSFKDAFGVPVLSSVDVV